MLLGDRLRECREKKKMTQQELAEKTGFSRGSIINWEKGIRIPNADILKKLAEALGVTVSYLMGETDMYHENIKRGSIQPVIEIPILDQTLIACAGQGNGTDNIYAKAEQSIFMPASSFGVISVDIEKKPFAVTVEGDSMEGAGIPDKSIVVVNPAEEIYDGDPVLVIFGIMRQIAIKWIFFKRDGSIELRAADPAYPPLIFNKEDIENDMIKIIGKVMYVINKPKRGF